MIAMRLVPVFLLGTVSLAGGALLAAQSWPPVPPAAPVAPTAPVAPSTPTSLAWSGIAAPTLPAMSGVPQAVPTLPGWPVAPSSPALQPPLQPTPPAPFSAADPADSLYRLAREAVTAGDYGRAASLFHAISSNYPKSDYAPDALYWEAYALFRIGGRDNLQRARSVLDRQASLFPDIASGGDAPSLRTRIEGALAAGGDVQAAEAVVRAASASWAVPAAPAAPSRVPAAPAAPAASVPAAPVAPAAPGARLVPPVPPTAPMSPAAGLSPMSPMGDGGEPEPGCPPARDDERVVALNALLQMDAERALPLLERVLERRDACSANLRRRAIFLLSQKSGPKREELLLRSVRNDPDPEVRSQAVFWLAQTESPRATEILEEILRTSADERLRERAIFALSNQDTPRARQAVRDFASSAESPAALRERSIFWLGQRPSAENAAFLQELYRKVDDARLKERIIFSLAQARQPGNEQWLMQVARDQQETAELRGRALFWLGQGGLVSTAQLGSLYGEMEDRAVKEQVILALAQRSDDSTAVDQLMKIARSDGDRKLRERAIFWLGQSKDPRVAAFLLELIDR